MSTNYSTSKLILRSGRCSVHRTDTLRNHWRPTFERLECRRLLTAASTDPLDDWSQLLSHSSADADDLAFLNSFVGAMTVNHLPASASEFASRPASATAAADTQPLVEYSVQVLDQAGQALSQLEVGDEFLIQIHVRDLRNASESDHLGIFAAYASLEVDGSGIELTGPPEIGDAFQLVRSVPDADAQGQFAGGVSTNWMLDSRTTDALLFQVPARAASVGTATLRASGEAPAFGQETLLVGNNEAVPPSAVEFGTTQLAIRPDTFDPPVGTTPALSTPESSPPGLVAGPPTVSESIDVATVDLPVADSAISAEVRDMDSSTESGDVGDVAVAGLGIQGVPNVTTDDDLAIPPHELEATSNRRQAARSPAALAPDLANSVQAAISLEHLLQEFEANPSGTGEEQARNSRNTDPQDTDTESDADTALKDIPPSVDNSIFDRDESEVVDRLLESLDTDSPELNRELDLNGPHRYHRASLARLAPAPYASDDQTPGRENDNVLSAGQRSSHSPDSNSETWGTRWADLHQRTEERLATYHRSALPRWPLPLPPSMMQHQGIPDGSLRPNDLGPSPNQLLAAVEFAPELANLERSSPAQATGFFALLTSIKASAGLVISKGIVQSCVAASIVLLVLARGRHRRPYDQARPQVRPTGGRAAHDVTTIAATSAAGPQWSSPIQSHSLAARWKHGLAAASENIESEKMLLGHEK